MSNAQSIRPCIDCGVLRYAYVDRLRCRECAVKFRAELLRQKGPAAFWALVDKSGGPDACWEWQGRLNYSGYAAVDRKTPHARFTTGHRYSWYLENGPIPDGLFVCHRCDNPKCVNPSHLFIGTNIDNVADRVAKGRSARVRGDKSGMAKITDAQVLELRRLRREGVPLTELALRYGIDRQTVSAIGTGRQRSHVKEVA